jgi:hypothetical protein
MSSENQESQQHPVDAIHYYPKDKRLVIEVEGGVTFALSQNAEGLLAQLLLSQAVSQRAAVLKDDVVSATKSPQVLLESAAPAPEPASEAAAEPAPTNPETPVASSKKRENQYLLTGRLKSKPVEGKPDGRGRPTAYARFAAHLDGSEEAWMLSTSFLAATRRIALELASNDLVTLEGYVNKNPDPEKMDRYNVFRFLNYPGKPPRLETD